MDPPPGDKVERFHGPVGDGPDGTGAGMTLDEPNTLDVLIGLRAKPARRDTGAKPQKSPPAAVPGGFSLYLAGLHRRNTAK